MQKSTPEPMNTSKVFCPAHIHALVGDGKHGRTEPIQTFRGPACPTTFSARRHTPLYHLKTPSHHIGLVLTALAEGLDPSAAERVFGYRQATITIWLSRTGEHAQTLHQHYFSTLQLPHVQLDELRTRLRSCTQVIWLWLAIDPCTKLLPVLHLGSRTQNMAHTVIHFILSG
jgi:transposase-like protein